MLDRILKWMVWRLDVADKILKSVASHIGGSAHAILDLILNPYPLKPLKGGLGVWYRGDVCTILT